MVLIYLQLFVLELLWLLIELFQDVHSASKLERNCDLCYYARAQFRAQPKRRTVLLYFSIDRDLETQPNIIFYG